MMSKTEHSGRGCSLTLVMPIQFLGFCLAVSIVAAVPSASGRLGCVTCPVLADSEYNDRCHPVLG